MFFNSRVHRQTVARHSAPSLLFQEHTPAVTARNQPENARHRGFTPPRPVLGPRLRKRKALLHAVCKSLNVDSSTGVDQFLLQLLCVFLAHALFQGLRSTFDEILGFLEAQPGRGADNLNHRDLL